MDQQYSTAPAAKSQKNAEDWISEANFYFNQKRFYSASGSFKQGLVLAPDNLEAWHRLGLCFIYTNKPSEALRVSEIILERKADFRFNPLYRETFTIEFQHILQMKNEGKTLDLHLDIEALHAKYKKQIELLPRTTGEKFYLPRPHLPKNPVSIPVPDQYRYGIRVDPEEEIRIVKYYENLRELRRNNEQPLDVIGRNSKSHSGTHSTESGTTSSIIATNSGTSMGGQNSIIRCILFDLDQTLVDSAHLKEYRDAGRWNQVTALIPRMRENPLIKSMLADLRQQGLKLGCVTSSSHVYAKEMCRHFGWRFDCLVTYHDTVRHKPDPQPFERALLDLQLSSGECIAVGDSEFDQIAAHAAGIRAVIVNWFDREGKVHSNTDVLSSPDQLCAYCRSSEFFNNNSVKNPLVVAEKSHEYPESSVPSDRYFIDPEEEKIWRTGSDLFLTPYYTLHLKNNQLNPKHDTPSSKILNLKNIDRQNERLHQSGSTYCISKMDQDRIQQYAEDIRALIINDRDLTICVMPKSTHAREPSGIRRIAEALCGGRWQDGTKVIERKIERMTKHLGGDRSYENELASLGITDPAPIEDRIVLLLDDITTTGNSLRAGRSLLLSHGARAVIMFALGKTSE